RLAPAMPYQAYAQLSPEDLRAIIAYLRTLTPRPNPPAQPANDTTPGGPMPRGMALPPPTVETSTGVAAGVLVIVGALCTRRVRRQRGILGHRGSHERQARGHSRSRASRCSPITANHLTALWERFCFWPTGARPPP
ncbi:MAG TPA: hypothetical protein VF916_10630, partial [Ktedonobacterales bacterium]